jgi:hypothetical protein
MRVLWIVLLSAGMAGCEVLGLGKSCYSELVYGVGVSIVDASTGLPITHGTGKVVVSEGAYADSVVFTEDERCSNTAALAGERPGVYTVEVVLDGYRRFIESDVRVRDGECHVSTAHVVARMQPDP